MVRGPVTGRFAPTPSGDLHLGNLRTALLAWLFARAQHGGFVLRVDDLTTGAAPRRELEQLEDLAAIGIDHDGPVPRQSERTDRYEAVIEQLVVQGRTYRCFCSRREIREAAAAPHGPFSEGAYAGTCARLGTDEVGRRLAEGRPAATRLRADGVVVGFQDRWHGWVEAPVDDFVLRRADGVAAYNLAVVLDDADQGVDQVVRGEDLLHTTPRQVLVQRVLGLATPEYVHVPLVHGPDGERLAKRHGAISLRAQLADGHDVEQVVGRLGASMGLAAPGERADAALLLARFDPDDVRVASHVPPG